MNIEYTLSFPEAQAHYTDVEMTISGLKQPSIDLKMPVWTPGSYLIREYAKNVEALTVWNGNKALSAKKINKNTWHIALHDAEHVKVKYRIYCFEISVRTSFVNAAHAFISPAGTFLYPAGMLAQASTIHITPYKGWKKVSTSLDMAANDPFTIYAPNYDILYDSPIEIGNQDVFGFYVDGVKYEVAMCLGGNYDKVKLKTDLARMVSVETNIFGENPNKRYVFIVHNYLKGGGGLEHLGSTVLGATRDGYADTENYQRFLALAAHEHFHLWNVKRLRPIALGPFDYDNENYTPSLWIAEGFTNYYDNLVVHRMGLYKTEDYLDILAADINTVENSPGSKVQSLYDASFDAWIKHYRPNENSINSTISYYTKGGIMAMLLDLIIINNSKGKYSLNDVMKYAYNKFYKHTNGGYTEEGFKKVLEKFAGKNLDIFYERYIYGVANIEYNKYLRYAGFKLVDNHANDDKPSLGLVISKVNDKTLVSRVLRNGSAWKYGINVNDQLVGVNGKPVKDFTSTIENKKVGDSVIIDVIRDGLPVSFKIKLLKNKQLKYSIVSVDNPTAHQHLVRNKWLSKSL